MEPWEMTPLQYQEDKALRAAGIPILNAADAREHERIVRNRHEAGEHVPKEILERYKHSPWLKEVA